MSAPSVGSSLAEARAFGLDRLDAHLLLAHVLQRPRTWLLAHDDVALSAAQAGAWNALATRRTRGEPLAYLIGEKEFYGLALRVQPGVLIPRPETELLVEKALEVLRAGRFDTSPPRVLDLGTGSGAVALACKSNHPQVATCASDSSQIALDVARANALRLGLPIEFRQGSWWSPWGGERFDLVLSNPPYVGEGDPHLAALRHEPIGALTAGSDGLSALRSIVHDGPRHLRPGGWLWLEHGCTQAPDVRALLLAGGFSGLKTCADLAGRPRCSGGRI